MWKDNFCAHTEPELWPGPIYRRVFTDLREHQGQTHTHTHTHTRCTDTP